MNDTVTAYTTYHICIGANNCVISSQPRKYYSDWFRIRTVHATFSVMIDRPYRIIRHRFGAFSVRHWLNVWSYCSHQKASCSAINMCWWCVFPNILYIKQEWLMCALLAKITYFVEHSQYGAKGWHFGILFDFVEISKSFSPEGTKGDLFDSRNKKDTISKAHVWLMCVLFLLNRVAFRCSIGSNDFIYFI